MRRACGAMIVAMACCQVAVGQLPPGMTKLERIAGTVESTDLGMLEVLDAHGTRWALVPTPDSYVSVRGQTTRDMVRRGQFVSCEVRLGDDGKPAEPVKNVVVTGGGLGGVMISEPSPQEGGLPVLKPAPRGKRPAGVYIVAGQIKSIKDDTIAVTTGRERIELELAADATFGLETTNIGLASRGDRVVIEGVFTQPGQLRTTWLEIILANPLVPPAVGRPRARVAQ